MIFVNRPPLITISCSVLIIQRIALEMTENHEICLQNSVDHNNQV